MRSSATRPRCWPNTRRRAASSSHRRSPSRKRALGFANEAVSYAKDVEKDPTSIANSLDTLGRVQKAFAGDVADLRKALEDFQDALRYAPGDPGIINHIKEVEEILLQAETR